MDAFHAKTCRGGISRTRALLTDEELEVADLLFELPELIFYFKQRRRACHLPGNLRWGVRKSRTVPRDERSLPSRSRQPLPPESCAATAIDTTSSPATPMSFPWSSGEGNSNSNDAAGDGFPTRLKPPAFKNCKERNEWMEEQCRGIDSLTDSNANLRRKIEEYRALLQGLAAEYYKLRLRESMMPPAGAPAESANAVSGSRWRGTNMEPETNLADLNKLPAEATVDPSSVPAVQPPPVAEECRRPQQQQHEKATMFAEARRTAKRRLAMQREKSWPSGRRASDPLITRKQRLG